MASLARVTPALVTLLAGCASGSESADVRSDARPAGASYSRAAPTAAHATASPQRAGARFRAFVALERANAVAVLEGPPWRRARRLRVALGPHNVDASPRRDLVAVTSPPANAVTILGARGRVRTRARVSGAPHDSVFTADGRHLWVTAEQDSRIVQLRMPGARAVRSVPMPGRPHDITLAAGGSELWVTIDGSSTVERRSARTGRRLGRARPGGAPHDLAAAPNGREVWLSNWSSGLLTVASVRTGRAIASVQAGVEPHHFAFTRRRAWASDNGRGTVVRIGIRSRRVLGRTSVGGSPHHIAAVGDNVLVAVHATGRVVALSRHGGRLASIHAGRGPHGIAALPATGG